MAMHPTRGAVGEGRSPVPFDADLRRLRGPARCEVGPRRADVPVPALRLGVRSRRPRGPEPGTVSISLIRISIHDGGAGSPCPVVPAATVVTACNTVCLSPQAAWTQINESETGPCDGLGSGAVGGRG